MLISCLFSFFDEIHVYIFCLWVRLFIFYLLKCKISYNFLPPASVYYYFDLFLQSATRLVALCGLDAVPPLLKTPQYSPLPKGQTPGLGIQTITRCGSIPLHSHRPWEFWENGPLVTSLSFSSGVCLLSDVFPTFSNLCSILQGPKSCSPSVPR